jgi:putative copper resistance protein D
LSPDSLSVFARACDYLGVLQAAGAALFLLRFGALLEASGASVRRLGGSAALAAMPAVAACLLLDAARMAGDYQGMLDPELLRLACLSGSGAALLLQFIGLALVALTLRRQGPLAHGRAALAAVGIALAIVSFPLTGHTAAHAGRSVLAPLLVLHVALAAFWLGSLLPLLLALRRDSLASTAALLRAFSSQAGWLVPLIPAAGVAMACVLLPDFAALRRPYGLLLLAKFTLFLLLMGLAASNRWRWTPALAAPATGGSVGAGARAALQRSILAEYVLISAVLAATAVLTTYYSPDH